MYTKTHCTGEDVMNTDLEGRYLILRDVFLKDNYRDEKYQLVKVLRVSPDGNKITVCELNDDPEKYVITNKEDILGFAIDKVVIEHREKYES